MSTAVRTVSRPSTPIDVVAMQCANPTRLVVTPLAIIVGVIVVIVGVSIGIQRAGGDAGPAAYGSGAVAYSVSGFLFAIGLQAVTSGFPLALALGATRRTVTLGILSTALLESALITIWAFLLLGLEGLTGGWFVGARVVGAAPLGAGDPLALAAIAFLGTLVLLTVGGVYGAAWVRFGALGPLLLSASVVVLVGIAVLAFLPQLIALAPSFETWWLAVAAVAVIAASTLGAYLLLRRAGVR